MDFKLVKPGAEYRESYLEGLRAFRAEGLDFHPEMNEGRGAVDFAGHVEKLLGKASLRTERLVPETELWGIVDHRFAGRICIRHDLTDALRKVSGHIGYDTVPSFRGRGVATLMLRHALPIARALGVSKLLITCDDTNIGSIRVIEKNGGILEQTRVLDPARPPKRYYWITLDEG